MSNKLMTFGNDRKKWWNSAIRQKKVLKESGFTTQGRKQVEVATLFPGYDMLLSIKQ